MFRRLDFGRFTRRARVRLLAPVAAVAAIGLGAWIPTVTASASTPNLPALTPQQVVTKVLRAHVAGFSGSFRWTANFGIPDLGSVVSGIGGGGTSSLTTLLSGSHAVKVWDAGVNRQRLALPGSLSEVDFVHNGQQAWYYDSNTDTVTHLVPGTAASKTSARTSRVGAAAPGAQSSQMAEPDLSPDQIATRLLSHLSPTTGVSVSSPVYVAGRATYQLVLTPAAGTKGAAVTTVREIAIAVDAATGMPLRVDVDAKGQTAPAMEIGFASISFGVPSASEFAPLTGTTHRTRTIDGSGGGGNAGGSNGFGLGAFGFPAFVGTAWGSVASFDQAGLGQEAGQLLQATTAVSGSFGVARLFQTTLLNVLFLPDGRVVAGFVTPAALEAAAASSSR